MALPKAVYVHIPFCEQICHYCDFNKVYLKGQPVEEYVKACEKEMKEAVSQFPYDHIETVYIGGGTPSSLSSQQLEPLLESINQVFLLQKPREYTFEINPGNISDEKLSLLKSAGVNRLSIGVQAFQEDLLKKIGRTHNEKDIYRTIESARRMDFENISIDLMFGLPGQSVANFIESIEKSVELEIPHFSAYSLKVEEKTVFHQLQRKGKLPLPPEDDEVAMYDVLINMLTEQNYHHYEISNFSKNGYESLHNLTYWNNEEYYGIGAGAHGYVSGQRYANVGPIKKYINNVHSQGRPLLESHVVSTAEKMEEEMFLGLRKLEGVSISQFQSRFNKDPFEIFGNNIERLKSEGLLKVEDDRISLTKNGLFVANEVFEKFLL